MRYTQILYICILLMASCKNEGKTNTSQISVPDINTNMSVAYIGTYTKKEGHVNGKADGIYTIYQDSVSGAISFGDNVAFIINPSFVIISKDKMNLYAVSELGPKDGASGYLYSYKINPDYSLTELSKITTQSYAPCHISEDVSGNFVFVANYVGGVVMMYERLQDGSLKEKQKITLDDPENSHPHSVSISKNNKYVYITDLGNNRIYTYILDAENKKMQSHSIPYIQLNDNTGPRHFEFSATQDYAFSINEHSSTISTFKIAASGGLLFIDEISTLPSNYIGNNSTADIHLHPSGKYLYGSNRGHNSIASYSFREETGELELIGFTPTKGEKPRNFAISGDGKFMYVANQDSDNITSFEIVLETGLLTEIKESIEVMTPVCINFF